MQLCDLCPKASQTNLIPAAIKKTQCTLNTSHYNANFVVNVTSVSLMKNLSSKWYKPHQIPKLECFSFSLAAVFAQSIQWSPSLMINTCVTASLFVKIITDILCLRAGYEVSSMIFQSDVSKFVVIMLQAYDAVMNCVTKRVNLIS